MASFKKIAVIISIYSCFFVCINMASAADCAEGQRACYCWSDYANRTPLSSVQATNVGCFQFKPGCDSECKKLGYKSNVLVDPADGVSGSFLNTLPGMSAPSLNIKKSADGDCNYKQSLWPCLCSNDYAKAEEVGCFNYREQCDQKCAEKDYKYAVLFNTSYYSPHTLDNQRNLNDTRNALQSIIISNNSSSPGVSGPQITDRLVPGQTTEEGIIKCGRPGQQMCTICDFIQGLNTIIQYLMKIAIGVALLAMAIGGILYVVSAGESAMMDMAKKAITNALIGFVIIFAAYLIINTTLVFLGSKPDLGINARWGVFECTRTVQ